MWQDLRHGLRMLGKNPGFTALAVLSIAIGVGANAAMFGVADTMVLSPLTIARPDDLVTVTAVVPMVLRQGLTLTLVGTVAGMAASYWVGGALRAALPFPRSRVWTCQPI